MSSDSNKTKKSWFDTHCSSKGDLDDVDDDDDDNKMSSSSSMGTGSHMHEKIDKTEQNRRKFLKGNNYASGLSSKTQSNMHMRVSDTPILVVEALDLDNNIDFNPSIVEKALANNVDFERAIEEGDMPLLRFPYIPAVPPLHQASFLLEFELPNEVLTRGKLMDRLSGVDALDLKISGSQIKQHFKDEFVFTDGADHFFPERVQVVNMHTVGVGIHCTGQLVAYNSGKFPGSYSRSYSVNGQGTGNGFSIPDGCTDQSVEVKGSSWDADFDVVSNMVFHQWKAIDMDKMEAALKATKDNTGLYYSVILPPGTAGFSLDNALDYFIIGNMPKWLDQAEKSDQYSGWTFKNARPDSTNIHKWNIPVSFADESLEQLKRVLKQHHCWSFDKDIVLKLYARNPAAAGRCAANITRDLADGYASRVADPSLESFRVTIRVWGTFHTVMTQDKPHKGGKFLVGDIPHDHNEYQTRLSNIDMIGNGPSTNGKSNFRFFKQKK